MKLKYKLLAASFSLMFFAAPSLFATTVTIMAGGDNGMSFVPATGVTIHLGDTVKWVWDNGSHTTTSTTIPAGAAAWDEPIDATDSTFIYVPTVAGVYNYKCIPHEAMGMVGSFTVEDTTTGISTIAAETIKTLYPNPSSLTIQVNFKQGLRPVFEIYDLTGRRISAWQVIDKTNASVVLNISALPEGSYLLRMISKNQTDTRNIIIER